MRHPTILVKDPAKGLTRKIRESLTFGVIVGNRGFFPDYLAKKGRDDIVQVVKGLGHKVIILSEKDTPFGTVMTHQDAKKCSELFRRNAEIIDGIIVSLPNFGDEKAVANTLRWSNLDVPILIQAEPDEPKKMKVGQRRDSYCGKISVCSNLTQYGIPFTLTTEHTSPVEGPLFKEDLQTFAAICRVVNGLKGARVGAIGARPAAFNTVRYSEKLLEIAGISVETIDLSEIIGQVRTMETDDAVKGRIDAIKSYVTIGDKAPPGSLEKIAKLAIVVDQWIEEYELDAIAFQCWTAIEDYLGVAPCAILSILSNNIIPAACEVDVTGALSMLALALASGSPAALLDWNNNYGTDPDKAVAFHCSNLPADILRNPKMDAHFSESFQADSGYGTISGRILPGPFTFARISTDDVEGLIMYYTGEGDFTDDELATFGGFGVMEIPYLQELLQEICLSGFPHHFAACRGNVSHIIDEALGTYLGFHS
ncbi:MAG: fucose isomerase [Candidatus Helarchaeota archaeon]|nr:fucose isomerase [Candidatus Helarchaeota archaeon]